MAGEVFNSRIYQNNPQMVLGFHGCDKSVVEKILQSNAEHLKPSKKDFDWLGSGIYFWLNDPQRAYEWACQKQRRSPKEITEPAVIGAIIDLGVCLNFCERESILLLQRSYEEIKKSYEEIGLDIREEIKNELPDDGGFSLIRKLDCAVIKNLHTMVKKEDVEFDTVYGYFQEGKDAFEGAGIKEKSHIQICVRNTDCIKGYFLPRKK